MTDDGKKALKAAYNKAYQMANRETLSAKSKAKYAADPEKYRALERAWRAANPDKARESFTNWRAANPDKARDRVNAWRVDNPEKYRAYRANWRAANLEKARAREKAWTARRRKQDPQFKLAKALRSRLHTALRRAQIKKSFQRAAPHLGCTIAEFMVYIDAQFEPWMNWDNWGKYGWHIDHIKPLASFDLSNPTHVKEAFHYTNLRPLHWRENLSKGARLER